MDAIDDLLIIDIIFLFLVSNFLNSRDPSSQVGAAAPFVLFCIFAPALKLNTFKSVKKSRREKEMERTVAHQNK